MSIVLRFLLHVVLPTLVGTAVYVGWRTTDLLVFRWIEFLHLEILVFRPTFGLPELLLYSLPDGCWVYAITSWMFLIWNRFVHWVWIGLILAVGAEFGQLFGLVQGTYQTLDVLFYVGGFVLAGVLNEKAPLVDHCVIHHGNPCVGKHE